MPVDSQYSSPVEALNLTVEPKPLPIEVNNSTIELCLPVEAKEKLAIIDSKYGLLVEANNSTTNSNDSLGFEKNSELISSIESIH